MNNNISLPQHFQDCLNEIYLISDSHEEKAFPVRKKEVKIFTHKPPAVSDTFEKSMFFVPEVDHIDAMVLYAPEMKLLQVLDNSASPSTISFTREVSEGFSFAASQSITTGLSFEAKFAVVKTTFKVDVTLSFSEEWTTTTTNSYTCEAPPYKKVYFYQGEVRAQVLRYNLNTFSFSYLPYEKGKYDTSLIQCTEAPI